MSKWPTRFISAIIIVAAVAASYLLSSALRIHVATTFTDLKSGPVWDRSAHKRMLGSLLTSQLSGVGGRPYWISFVEGLSVLPVGTPVERQDSFTRVSSDLPTESETWFSSNQDFDAWYLRFLGDLGLEAEKEKQFDQAELDAWHQVQTGLQTQGVMAKSAHVAEWPRMIERSLALFKRSPSLTEVSSALQKALITQQAPGGLRGAFYTEPALDVEADPSNLGTLLYSYSVGNASGGIGPLDSSDKDFATGTIEITRQMKEFVIKRPWVDESLLDTSTHRSVINGERFFGENGHLHLIPSHVIVDSEPQYFVSFESKDLARITGWVTRGVCCVLKLENEERYLTPSSVILTGAMMSGVDSRLRPEMFAVVSRMR